MRAHFEVAMAASMHRFNLERPRRSGLSAPSLFPRYLRCRLSLSLSTSNEANDEQMMVRRSC
uniref:Uncharacterized protein n=1 Tax=Arundo donax TaxID=35708 RepID=A0A0A9EV39_ARUDO